MSGSRVRASPKRAKDSSWKDYAIRFALGGVITGVAGWVADRFGPVVGGLFLAFPAILPASVTLVRRHEDTDAAGRDAYGALLGSLGLVAFATVIWLLATNLSWPLVLLTALVAWACASLAAFAADAWVRRRLRRPRGLNPRARASSSARRGRPAAR
jgi:CDP-diglyceride synthetase